MKNYLNRFTIIKMIIVVAFISVATIFAFNNSKFYDEPIGKITKIETKHVQKEKKSKDENYLQSMTIKLMNTKEAGTVYSYKSSYTTSQFRTTKYHKGQYVFLKKNISKKNGGYGKYGLKIMGEKYDFVWAFMISTLISLIFLIAGRRAILILASIAMNLVVFAIGIMKIVKFKDIYSLTLIMTAIFIIATLILLYGFSKKSIGAIFSSVTTVLIVLGIYMVIIHFSGRLGYEYIDYTNGNEPLEELFVSSLVFSILGAVMDVAITINSSVEEIVVSGGAKGLKEIINSIKGISNDIMGTMINVLFFTFVGDEIPINILKMANGYNMITLFSNGAAFEVIRFLIGAIGIALAVPVSGFFAVVLRARMIRKGGETC